MVSSRTTSNLRLRPWRDGVDHCLGLLHVHEDDDGPFHHPQNQRSTATKKKKKVAPVTVTSIRRGVYTYCTTRNDSTYETDTTDDDIPTNEMIRSVDVCFHDKDYQMGNNQHADLLLNDLFLAVGRNLPNLDSLIVRYNSTTGDGDTHSYDHHHHQESSSFPSVAALAAAVAVPKLAYLTLMGLPLVSDDYDMNNFAELLRIHPTLQSIVIQDCCFGKASHLEQLQHVSNAFGGQPQQGEQQGQGQRRVFELRNNKLVLPSTTDGTRSWLSILFCGYYCI
mmetsp:Transcript_10137/g.16190  ORF Transcript_10137/g.16190 Transcript_10137/m.16190 type:complete len:280 (+) Transcript_10137:60-899(+)